MQACRGNACDMGRVIICLQHELWLVIRHLQVNNILLMRCAGRLVPARSYDVTPYAVAGSEGCLVPAYGDSVNPLDQELRMLVGGRSRASCLVVRLERHASDSEHPLAVHWTHDGTEAP